MRMVGVQTLDKGEWRLVGEFDLDAAEVIAPMLLWTDTEWVGASSSDRRAEERLIRTGDGRWMWTIGRLSEDPEPCIEMYDAYAAWWLLVNRRRDVLARLLGELPEQPGDARPPELPELPSTVAVKRYRLGRGEWTMEEGVSLAGAEAIESAVVWTGLRLASVHTHVEGSTQRLIRTAQGEWLLQTRPDAFREMTATAAWHWLLANGSQATIAEHFGELEAPAERVAQDVAAG